MAYFQTIYTCALILAVIAYYGALFTEGRQLKSTKKQESNLIKDAREIGKHGSNTMNLDQKNTGNQNNVRVSTVDDVHSDGNSDARKTETLPPQEPNQSQALGASAKESVDDFRPTAPGSSPGVGHSFADHNVDIQPEGLGNSSGVHHTTSGNSNDFRPTVPGHSPGIGHSLRNKNVKPHA